MLKVRLSDGTEYKFKTREEYERMRSELMAQPVLPKVTDQEGAEMAPTIPMGQIAANLVGTVKDLAVGGITDSRLAGIRHATCRSCRFYHAGNDKCTICGCVMKAKTRVALARCPAGLWPDQQNTNSGNSVSTPNANLRSSYDISDVNVS